LNCSDRKPVFRIPVNVDYQIEIQALEETIAADRQAGLNPICMIGNACTINTGSVDDLQTLADICAREQLWFHVDGAIGALVPLAPRRGYLMDGIQRADSIAMDLHKWLHVPFEAGVALIRNEELHRHTFSLTPDYLSHTARGLAGGEHWFGDYGLLTRSSGLESLALYQRARDIKIRAVDRPKHRPGSLPGRSDQIYSAVGTSRSGNN
jgi:glutamate/tyrosine decarboxylase-like PLP-dependent enzyme